MRAIADLASRYEILLYIALVAGAAFYLRAFLRADRQLAGAVFGLEREALHGRRSSAFSMLFLCLFLGTTLYVVIHLVVPALDIGRPGGGRATPSVLVTPIEPSGPVLAPAPPTLSPDQLTSIALGTPRPTATATEVAIRYGTFLNAIIAFIVIAFVVWQISRKDADWRMRRADGRVAIRPSERLRALQEVRSIGSVRMRLPVAAKIAFVTAGATLGTPGSPRPPAASPESRMCTSTTGISLIRSIL